MRPIMGGVVAEGMIVDFCWSSRQEPSLPDDYFFSPGRHAVDHEAAPRYQPKALREDHGYSTDGALAIPEDGNGKGCAVQIQDIVVEEHNESMPQKEAESMRTN